MKNSAGHWGTAQAHAGSSLLMAAQGMTDKSPAGAAEVEASAAGSAVSTVSQAISSPGACSPEVASDSCFEVPSMMPNPSACNSAQVGHENRSLLEGGSCVRKRSRQKEGQHMPARTQSSRQA